MHFLLEACIVVAASLLCVVLSAFCNACLEAAEGRAARAGIRYGIAVNSGGIQLDVVTGSSFGIGVQLSSSGGDP